jgi:hypothetical protein
MASNKYVPPALRSKAIPTASDFPALGTARVQNNTWKTSFAVLASDWNEHAEEETAKREFKAAVEKREADKRAAEQRAFVNRKRPVDAIYDMDCEEDRVEDSIWAAAGAPKEEENGWTTVEPKLKKELTLEERIARDQKVEEEEKRAQAAREAARDSVWGDASEWDYRDRRAVA